jgi:hypothetical protein
VTQAAELVLAEPRRPMRILELSNCVVCQQKQ